MARRRTTKRGDASKAVGLIRVSTDEQHLGPEAQREALERWCAAEGVELVAVHMDLGVSGAAPIDKRPGLLAALADLEAHGAGVLVAAKRDRVARDVMLAAMVERMTERAGAVVVAADGTGNGEGPEAVLMRRMVDAFAEYERGIIAARTRAALAVKKSRRERVGAPAFGYRLADDGVRLVEDADEQEAIRLIRALRAEGETQQRIVDRLNADGVPARGKRWHQTTVSRILRRAA